MSCLYDTETAARYVAGTLDAVTVEAYEPHLVGCADCQQRVRTAATVRSALQAASGAKPVRRGTWIAAAAAVAAAIVVFVVVRGADDVRALSQFDPPTFVGVRTRGSSDSADARVLRAMEAYNAGDYRAAARGLAGADADSSAAVAFYLSASLLQIGDADGALRAARRAQHPAENPYATDASLVAAKAWLRKRRTDSALVELDRAAGAVGAAGAHARALRDSVLQLGR